MKKPARLSQIEQARSTAASIARFATAIPPEILALILLALGGAL